jgi:hypothetical protein
MALSGAGNPVGGSNPAGTGAGLSYTVNHAFGYSGLIDTDNNEATLLQFLSPSNTVIVGWWQGHYYENGDENFRWVLYFNNEIVQSSTETIDDQSGRISPVNIVIPPSTEVKLTAQNISDTTAREIQASLVGRLY